MKVTYAQTLEEINFSPNQTTPLNTYTTGINNKGFVCGYYEALTGDKVGYVITPLGKRIMFPPGQFPTTYSSITVEDINDSCTIIINATTSTGVVDIYKATFSVSTQTYTIVAVSGNGQSGIAKPFGITNKDVYSGWYPNLTDRWGFMLNDGITSTLPTWNATRYNLSPTYFFKGNDNDLYCGFYIDAGLYYPLVFDAQANSFDILPFTNSMKPKDISNNNRICGEYKQGNGVYCGFYGNYSSGVITNFTSINTLFSSTSIQSIINGCNDSMAFVGSYLHPTTNKWVGFIYRPNQSEYRLPKFAYATDTWTKLLNNAGSGPLDVFSPNFYSNFNYSSTDPFIANGNPLLTPLLYSIYGPTLAIPNAVSVSWKGFCSESKIGPLATIANSTNIFLYENNFKPLLMSKYVQATYSSGFNGYCFGFSQTALLHKYRPDLFSQWYNKPLNFDISQAQNTDVVSVLAIERAYLKQYDPLWQNVMFPITTSYWRGMYRFKNEYLKDSATVNPQSLGMGLGIPNTPTAGGHNVLPYKIRTPKKFPFDTPTQAFDTLYIYDSNYPNDSSQYFTVKAPFVENGGDTAMNSSYTAGSNYLYEIRFQKVGIRDNIVTQYSDLNKTTRATLDSTFKFTIERNVFYSLKNASSQVMKFDANGFSNSCSNVLPNIPEGVFINKPVHSQSDTNSTFTLTSSNYMDSTMQWAIHKDYLTMGISRQALPSEIDHSTFNHRMITYGNPDANIKKLNCYFIQIAPDASQASTVLINDLNMVQGDSVVTENPSDYIYRITKMGNGSTTYNLNTYTFSNDTAKQFNTNGILLVGNASHTITTLYPNGGTVVFVDNGNNGSIEDTLFVTEIPLGNLEMSSKNKFAFSIFPVPTQDILNIRSGQIDAGNYKVVVANAAGQILEKKQCTNWFSDKIQKMDVSKLPAANYLIFIVDQHNQVVYQEKFIKK